MLPCTEWRLIGHLEEVRQRYLLRLFCKRERFNETRQSCLSISESYSPCGVRYRSDLVLTKVCTVPTMDGFHKILIQVQNGTGDSPRWTQYTVYFRKCHGSTHCRGRRELRSLCKVFLCKQTPVRTRSHRSSTCCIHFLSELWWCDSVVVDSRARYRYEHWLELSRWQTRRMMSKERHGFSASWNPAIEEGRHDHDNTIRNVGEIVIQQRLEIQLNL